MPVTIKTRQANSNITPPTHLYPLSTKKKIISVDGKALPTLFHPQLQNKKKKQKEKKFYPTHLFCTPRSMSPEAGSIAHPWAKPARPPLPRCKLSQLLKAVLKWNKIATKSVQRKVPFFRTFSKCGLN